MAVSELDDSCAQFAAFQAQAEELTAGLDEARFNWRSAPNQWSIEECLAHLIIVGQRQIPALETAIQHARECGWTGDGPFSYGPVERFVLDLAKPPVRNPLSAPARFRPLHGQPVTGVLTTFLHLQSQFRLQAEAARGLDLRRVKVPTPRSRFLRMSLGMTFAIAAAHERRHMEQAKRVRDLLG